ncbi:MAG TPA: GNAT family N-acetyltransferase [Rhizomicrobium sp.]|nr:GNAT family N-acetyltransferase [Rhizomicrobium sp.]
MVHEIRHLEAGDAAVLDRIANGVFDNALRKEFVAEFLRGPQNHLCVAIDDNVVVGFASAIVYNHPDKPREMWINEVGVAPSHQGQGLGKALLAALFERARTLGCHEAWVLTETDNSAARALYRSAGGTEQADTVYVTFALAPLTIEQA